MSALKLPLALSVGAHAIVLALLLALPQPAAPVEPPVAGGIEVTFAPALPQPPAPAPPQPAKAEPEPPAPPPAVKVQPPAPNIEPPPKIEPPPPARHPAVAMLEPLPLPPPPKPPPPPRRPAIERSPRLPFRSREAVAPPVPPIRALPSAPTRQAGLAPARVPPPAPAASATISPGYEALLAAWLNRHKQYPETARERGEEGRAVVRFAVERSGRVTEFAVTRSSGYADLDAAIEQMMRGALLPPFPAEMTQPSITVSVTIRFSLER